jgi:hypothetical protein
MKTKYLLITLIVSGMMPFALIAQDDFDNANQFESPDIFGPQEGEWEITLGGNGSSDRKFDAGGFGMSGSLGYFLSEASEVSLRHSMSVSDFGDTVWNASTRLAYDYHFDLERFRPFIGANAGFVYGESVKETGAAGLEAGFKFYALEKTFIFAMAEYAWLFEDSDGVDDQFDDGQFLYSLGIGFNF